MNRALLELARCGDMPWLVTGHPGSWVGLWRFPSSHSGEWREYNKNGRNTQIPFHFRLLFLRLGGNFRSTGESLLA